MPLTREQFFSKQDITVKEISIPATIPAWGGETVFIKQLTRGQQDDYSKRVFSGTRMRQNANKEQDITGLAGMYGNDAWLCVRGCCDESGKAIFKDADIEKLNEKSGEAIGWIAKEILLFSGMAGDIPLEDEVKN